MSFFSKKSFLKIILILIFILSLVLRLYRLDKLPAEMWGDVTEHYKLTKSILDKNFFLDYRFGGDGPLFSYLSAIVSLFFGLSFYSLKLTTVFVGVSLTLTTYFLSLEYFKEKEIACLSSFLTAVSFWSLSFSRQAKPHILVPLLVTLTFIFYLKKKTLLAGLFLGLGMYTQAGFWGMIFFFLSKFKILFVALVVSFPFVSNFARKLGLILEGSGFFGEKLGLNSSFSIVEVILRLLTNFGKNILSFNFKGDFVFRHNIPGQPHLDFLSGVFFLLGFFLIIKRAYSRKDNRLLLNLILPFFVIQIPSVLDINSSGAIPNMGRMIGVMPFTYIIVAYGIYFVSRFFKEELVKKMFFANLLSLVLFINFYRYFFIYPEGLVHRNVPFDKIIASRIDQYSQKTEVVIVGCCWDQGEPGPDGIRFRLKYPRKIHFFEADNNPEKFSCRKITQDYKGKDLVLIVAPKDGKTIKEVNNCLREANLSVVEEKGWKIACFIEGRI